jgi:NAD(P)-dependent dehydrogenase (short-subunit alcohol dehydrogenase family)
MRLLPKRRSNRASNRLGSGVLVAAGLFAGAITIRRISRPRVNLRGKVVLITGGSRGLGLSLAFELGSLGSHLALCARDPAELEEARNRLAEKGIDAAVFPCDISEESEIAPLVARVLDRFGRIDVLINNAGIIRVAPLHDLQHSDFEQAMNTMFWAPVNLSLAVFPHMKQQGSGHIVDITSVGGRVSVPHLLPYCCAKFAFVAFSRGLGAESEAHGVHVLTVVPGLMRTGSYLNAEFKGPAEKEFAWFGLIGNLPGFSIAANYAARSVVKALQRGRRTRTISLPAKILIGSEALLPELTQKGLAAVNRYLVPASDGRKQTVSGKILNSSFNAVFQALTSLGKTAARQLNE